VKCPHLEGKKKGRRKAGERDEGGGGRGGALERSHKWQRIRGGKGSTIYTRSRWWDVLFARIESMLVTRKKDAMLYSVGRRLKGSVVLQEKEKFQRKKKTFVFPYISIRGKKKGRKSDRVYLLSQCHQKKRAVEGGPAMSIRGKVQKGQGEGIFWNI